MRKNIGIFICFGIFSTAIFADPVSLNPRPRMQGMGGAGLATLGDQDSAMINPAALAEVEKSKLELFPLLIEVPFDVGLLGSFKDYDDVRSKAGATETEKKDAFQKFISDAATTATAMRVNLYPSYTRKYMHFGLLVDMYTDPRVRAGGVTSNQVVELGGSSGTIGAILAGGYGFMDDALQVGVTLKPMYRLAITSQQEQRLHDILKGLNKDANADGSTPSISDEIFGKNKADQRAYAVGIDLGMKYNIPFMEAALKPTVGLTIQDVGDTRFVGDYDRPSNIPQSISLGVAVHPILSIFRNAIALDLRNINKEEEFLNKLHFGLESVVWNLLAIRAGLSQGYLTGGVGLMLKILDLDLYISSKEAGHYSHIQDITTIGFRLGLGW